MLSNSKITVPLTFDQFKGTDLYKQWTNGHELVYAWNPYNDDNYPSFIVVLKNKKGFMVVRFFPTNSRMQVSVDHDFIKLPDLLEEITNKYSNFLK